jgi:hypothetical protein
MAITPTHNMLVAVFFLGLLLNLGLAQHGFLFVCAFATTINIRLRYSCLGETRMRARLASSLFSFCTCVGEQVGYQKPRVARLNHPFKK